MVEAVSWRPIRNVVNGPSVESDQYRSRSCWKGSEERGFGPTCSRLVQPNLSQRSSVEGTHCGCSWYWPRHLHPVCRLADLLLHRLLWAIIPLLFEELLDSYTCFERSELTAWSRVFCIACACGFSVVQVSVTSDPSSLDFWACVSGFLSQVPLSSALWGGQKGLCGIPQRQCRSFGGPSGCVHTSWVLHLWQPGQDPPWSPPAQRRQQQLCLPALQHVRPLTDAGLRESLRPAVQRAGHPTGRQQAGARRVHPAATVAQGPGPGGGP